MSEIIEDSNFEEKEEENMGLQVLSSPKESTNHKEKNRDQFEEEALGKVFPRNIKAEEALLGSILINPDAIGEVVQIISPEDFYKVNYRLIFQEMINIYERGGIIDTLLLINSLEKKKLMEDIGSEEIIYDLTEVVPTAANAVSYAKAIKEKSVQRSLIRKSEEIQRLAYEGYEDVDALLDKAESMIFEVAEKKEKKEIVKLSQLGVQKFKEFDLKSKNKDGIIGMTSGYNHYDELTSGFHGSDLLILAARPAMGKTAFALNLALNVARNEKHVLIYSLEMGNEQLFDRLLAIESKVKLKAIKEGNLTSEEYSRMGDGMGRLNEMNIYISDSSSVNILEIKATARRLKAEGRLDFMLIDYLQLISPMIGSRKSREQEISEISRSLKIIAKELNIPVVTLSQLSRSVEQRNDKRPILSDLRESGAIEQDADMVMFLYRDNYYNKDESKTDLDIPNEYRTNVSAAVNKAKEGDDFEVVELIIGKHRSGPTGTIKLGFRPQYQQFVNMENKE